MQVDDPVLKEILQRLIGEFRPKTIYLFGSRAKGTERADSDYDLLLVVESSDRSRLLRMDQAREALRGITASADVFVYTQEEFDEWKDEFSSIPETAVSTGMELGNCRDSNVGCANLRSLELNLIVQTCSSEHILKSETDERRLRYL